MELDPVKVLKCKVCGVELMVNANYPINEVTCRQCYVTGTPPISDKNVWRGIRRCRVAKNPPYPPRNLQVVQETTGKHWGFRWNARDLTTARLIETGSQSLAICRPTLIISLPLHGSQFNDCPLTIALPESIGYKGSIWFEGLDLDSPC